MGFPDVEVFIIIPFTNKDNVITFFIHWDQNKVFINYEAPVIDLMIF
jgi:hypothetical protein